MGNSLVSIEKTVGQLVAEHPGHARVFEKLGVDYCCGGKKTLSEACRNKGLDPSAVKALLEAGDDHGNLDSSLDVSGMSLTELADHIEQTHHVYLKRELPRLAPLIERIAVRHGEKDPRLVQLPYIFASFRAELEAHTAKEEQVLFPLIRQIDAGVGEGHCSCGTIENPIRVMEIEHQHAGDALAVMRKLTDDFAVRPTSCNTYRAAMHGLRELEADLHRHVHKENNVLFPRAMKKAS